jgi:hypothetical protein
VQSLQNGFAELVEAKLSPSAIEKLAKLVKVSDQHQAI